MSSTVLATTSATACQHTVCCTVRASKQPVLVAWKHTCLACISFTNFCYDVSEMSLSVGACFWCSKDRSWQVGIFLFACGNVGSFYAYGEWQLCWLDHSYVSTGQRTACECGSKSFSTVLIRVPWVSCISESLLPYQPDHWRPGVQCSWRAQCCWLQPWSVSESAPC